MTPAQVMENAACMGPSAQIEISYLTDELEGDELEGDDLVEAIADHFGWDVDPEPVR